MTLLCIFLTLAIDQVCILAMDGMLQFFTRVGVATPSHTQDALSFARAIPSFLLPGPLLYVPSTDSIVTASASCTVDSYRCVLHASLTSATWCYLHLSRGRRRARPSPRSESRFEQRSKPHIRLIGHSTSESTSSTLTTLLTPMSSSLCVRICL